MALIDNQNKVIYWDEVNWQWLPFVVIKNNKTNASLVLQTADRYITVNSKEEVLTFLKGRGYTLVSISNIGITEVSSGCYLYEGRVYKKEKGLTLKSLSKLLSIISEKSLQAINHKLVGVGILSKEQVKDIASKKVVIEFDGKFYSSYAKLAKDYGFSPSYLSKWLSKGMSLEEIISKYKPNNIVVDHLGVEYSCLEEMLNKWGITLKAYKDRKERRWSLKRILTTPLKSTQVAKECVDFNGRVFPSMKAMAIEYGINPTNILYHVKKGKTPAEALKHLLTEGKARRTVKDHLGNSFSSNTEMAFHWKVNPRTFRGRINLGWTIEEALTGERKE